MRMTRITGFPAICQTGHKGKSPRERAKIIRGLVAIRCRPRWPLRLCAGHGMTGQNRGDLQHAARGDSDIWRIGP